jgi:hypothetical protein
MFLHVDSVRTLERYTLRLEFNDGWTKDVDLSGQASCTAKFSSR